MATFPHPAAVLPGEADILAAVVADLSDDTAKLVYADWLDERADPRGKLLRKCVAAFRAGKGKKFPSLFTAPNAWSEIVGVTLMARLHGSALRSHADAFLRLARPALLVRSAKAGDEPPVGTSKLGGRPDLPPDVKWPTYQSGPLAFLAQFNLADLSASVACRELPATGLLSVFAAYNEDEGNDYFPEGSWRLFHLPDLSGLTRASADVPASAFPTCRLTFTEILTLPDADSVWGKDLGLKKNQVRVYDELHRGDQLGNRVLGHPSPLQNDPLQSKTERHLLTIDSDDNAGWMWGDGGLLYFTMSEADLKAQQFDSVRMEMQCC